MRRRTPLALLLLALLVPPACGPQEPRDPPAREPGDAATEPLTRVEAADTPAAQPALPASRPAAGEEARTGRIAVTGTGITPFTTLQVEGERSLTLVGALEEELRRLSGVTVRVHGRDVGEAPFGRRFEVRRYDVLEVDGQRPHVGTLITREGATWLATASDTLRIAQLPEPLQDQSGARVWIVGPRTGDALQIHSFGVIRPR